jgi:hypothetical protein
MALVKAVMFGPDAPTWKVPESMRVAIPEELLQHVAPQLPSLKNLNEADVKRLIKILEIDTVEKEKKDSLVEKLRSWFLQREMMNEQQEEVLDPNERMIPANLINIKLRRYGTTTTKSGSSKHHDRMLVQICLDWTWAQFKDYFWMYYKKTFNYGENKKSADTHRVVFYVYLTNSGSAKIEVRDSCKIRTLNWTRTSIIEYDLWKLDAKEIKEREALKKKAEPEPVQDEFVDSDDGTKAKSKSKPQKSAKIEHSGSDDDPNDALLNPKASTKISARRIKKLSPEEQKKKDDEEFFDGIRKKAKG